MFKKYNKQEIDAFVTELFTNVTIGIGFVTFIIVAFLFV